MSEPVIDAQIICRPEITIHTSPDDVSYLVSCDHDVSAFGRYEDAILFATTHVRAQHGPPILVGPAAIPRYGYSAFCLICWWKSPHHPTEQTADIAGRGHWAAKHGHHLVEHLTKPGLQR